MQHKNQYIEILKNPPETAKAYTRWWWYGCSVTKEEIKRQLYFIKNAYLGGVEIQILYPIHEDDEKIEISHIDFFSKEFFEIIDYTLNVAQELGIKVDFTLGSGWPFGGPFITGDMAPDILIPYQHDVIGPTSFSFDYTGILPGKIVGIFMAQMKNGVLIGDTLKDIAYALGRTWIYSWPWGEILTQVDIPEGHWRITTFVSATYRQKVGVPSPGMEGYVIDHCRKDVVDNYLDGFGSQLVKKIGKGRFRSFFCDSIELFGNNWTPILLEEFYKRRGYDLKPYMPALWSQVDDITPHIRYDYYKTMSELTIENFFENFTRWCSENGSISRIQAHGTWADILKAYASAHIPEGETFGEGDVYEVNTIHRRLASSAGNVYGRKIISNESFTWLRMPRFLVTLEMIKLACDAIFLDGINHIINHGYSYSPQVAGKPGWVFYASSVISHTNTWWEYYPEVSRYIQRVSAFLQRGSNYSEVAIYLPQNDIWADFPMSELHMGMKLEEYMGKEAINNIQKNGYWFNYINDEVINELGVISSQGLELNRNCYKVIILMGARRMPTETASKLKEFVEQGGILISAENYPNKACGFLNRESNEKHLNKIMVDLFSQHYDQWKNVGMGKTVVVSNRGAALIDCMKQALKPDVEINPNDGTIGYVHRKDDSDDIYFIANVSKDYKKVDIEFKTIDKGFIILNPLTAEELRPLHIDYLTECTRLRMEFEPNQSFIVIFSNNIDKSMDTSPVVCENIIAELSFDWQFEVSVLGFKRNLSQLNTWENFEQTRYYCGEGMYHKDIEVTRHILNYDRVFICFEKIYEVAEIFVNGASAGVIWKLPYELDVKKYLHEGRNSIQVKVVNLWINHYLNPHKEEPFHGETILDTWPYFGKIIDNIRARRLYSWREKQMVEELQPSGLCGEVYFKGRNWHI